MLWNLNVERKLRVDLFKTNRFVNNTEKFYLRIFHFYKNKYNFLNVTFQ